MIFAVVATIGTMLYIRSAWSQMMIKNMTLKERICGRDRGAAQHWYSLPNNIVKALWKCVESSVRVNGTMLHLAVRCYGNGIE